MVEISLSGSGEGPGWVTAPGYSTAPFSKRPSGATLIRLTILEHLTAEGGIK
jgi:hypothetical protein